MKNEHTAIGVGYMCPSSKKEGLSIPRVTLESSSLSSSFCCLSCCFNQQNPSDIEQSPVLVNRPVSYLEQFDKETLEPEFDRRISVFSLNSQHQNKVKIELSKL